MPAKSATAAKKGPEVAVKKENAAVSKKKESSDSSDSESSDEDDSSSDEKPVSIIVLVERTYIESVSRGVLSEPSIFLA